MRFDTGKMVVNTIRSFLGIVLLSRSALESECLGAFPFLGGGYGDVPGHDTAVVAAGIEGVLVPEEAVDAVPVAGVAFEADDFEEFEAVGVPEFDGLVHAA